MKVKKVESKLILLIFMFILLVLMFAPKTQAGNATPFEVTKQDGALVRDSYSQGAREIRRQANGSIVWVSGSKVNDKGNLWYRLTDGYWIYSGNVTQHYCSWTTISSKAATCTTRRICY